MPRRPEILLAQLPIPQAAALCGTGNVPLAAGSLAVAARRAGFGARLDVDILPPSVTDVLGDALLVDLVARRAPAFLGLSLYLWNVERSLHLAREVKKRSPATTVLIGGPEVGPDNPFVLAQDGWDVAVTGEAEADFPALLEALLAGRSPEGSPGVAVRRGGVVSAWGPPPRVDFPLRDAPSPYLDGTLPVEPRRSVYLETVRGCRSHCT
ncbi:MAG TPA: cobalamin-dependent protein, partial [Planctomycetota bacterium]|nr:cobalamin-dependent protein [Planctomycetota bacterium]